MNTTVHRVANGMTIAGDYAVQWIANNLDCANAGGNKGSLSDLAIEMFAPENTTPIVSVSGSIYYVNDDQDD